MQKIKDLLKQTDAKKWAGFTILWVVLITVIFYIFRANDDVSTTAAGNVVIYPSVFKAIQLFLGTGANYLWAVLSIILSAVGGFFVTATIDDTIELDPIKSMLIVFLCAAFSVAIVYVGGDNIKEFTHHTVTPEAYKAIENKKHVDYFFYEANQADSLFQAEYHTAK